VSAGVIPSPNIWHDPTGYERTNHGTDPDNVIDAAMTELHDLRAAVVLDIGCGTGFHLPRLAAAAGPTGSVVGVEPHTPLLTLARRRVARPAPGSAPVRVVPGGAQALPLPPAGVDVAQARWAYFFGPGCEPGLAELSRVMRRGGTAFVVDVDASRSSFGRWFRRALPRYDPDEVTRFWARQGWQRRSLDITWTQPDRAAFAAALNREFSAEVRQQVLVEHDGTGLDYAVNLFWRQF
jgi:ubiquinone/menaquinone biosynthesis C-methylase UbiE